MLVWRMSATACAVTRAVVHSCAIGTLQLLEFESCLMNHIIRIGLSFLMKRMFACCCECLTCYSVLLQLPASTLASFPDSYLNPTVMYSAQAQRVLRVV